MYVYCFNFCICILQRNTILWIVSVLSLYDSLCPRLGFRQLCVASFRGIRWHVAHNRRNMLKISEILLRWSLLAIYSVSVCATCGGTLFTLINFNQSFSTFELGKLLKDLCFRYCSISETRFQHFILLHCSFPEFDAKLNANPLFLQISYYNMSYLSEEIQLPPVENQRRRQPLRNPLTRLGGR